MTRACPSKSVIQPGKNTWSECGTRCSVSWTAGYLLLEDLTVIIEGAGRRYDLFRSRVKEVQAANG